MARIDSFLAQLIAHGADALLLESGNNLYLVKGEQRLPLTHVKSGQLMNQHLVALLGEIAPPEVSFRLQQGVNVEWDYSFGQCVFRAEFAVVGERFVARLREFRTMKVEQQPPPPSSPPPPPELDLLGPGQPAIEHYLRYFVKRGASDLHLTAGRAPMMRHDGDMQPLPGFPAIEAENLAKLVDEIMPPRNREEFASSNDTDFAYAMDVARIRCNVFKDRTGVGAVFRQIPNKILSAADLQLPEAVMEMCKLRKGLVVVTGPTGSGKSTTLAAMVDWINENRADHIITIEDPVEFVHEPKKCLVNQRQVGDHTDSFPRALRAALREDPDIILVGEMRDLETVATAIEMAETGHLVFGTLHTTTAASTVDRIVDQFPADRQEQVRQMLAESLKGVVAQTLCKKVAGGRAAALEVLVCNTAVSNLIREHKTFQLASTMQTSRNIGMRTLNDSLVDLVVKGLVDRDEAYSRAIDKPGFVGQLKAAQAPQAVTAVAA